MPGPAYRVVTERLVLRCWSPEDAPALAQAIEASLDHLRPFMDWSWSEPKSLDDRVDLLRGFRSDFDAGREFAMGVFDRADERRIVGATSLRMRASQGVSEVGYWLCPDATGRGLITEATAALARVAFEVETTSRLELRCDVGNGRSAAVARRLGFTLDGTLRADVPRGDGQGRRDMQVWSLLEDEYLASPAARAAIEAFDAAGRPLPLLRPG